MLTLRAAKEFKGLAGFIRLYWFGFIHAGKGVNITVQRLLLPVVLRSFFTRSKTLVVLHHYDKREQLSPMYHWNMRMLLWLLKSGYNNLGVVVVAPYWKTWLEQQGVSGHHIFHFPNLFNPDTYKPSAAIVKKKQVYLGQYGAKQHPHVAQIAEALTAHGYHCFYTTPYPEVAMPDAQVPVLHLSFAQYLKALQESVYTICLSAFNEGWNRTAHESLMAGTPVVGNMAGGLGDLLHEALQAVALQTNEVLEVILQNRNIHIPPAFIEQYHIRQISYYAKPIEVFCKA